MLGPITMWSVKGAVVQQAVEWMIIPKRSYFNDDGCRGDKKRKTYEKQVKQLSPVWRKYLFVDNK